MGFCPYPFFAFTLYLTGSPMQYSSLRQAYSTAAFVYERKKNERQKKKNKKICV